MKKISLFLLIFIMSVLLIACSNQEGKLKKDSDWEPTTYNAANKLDGVFMTVKDGMVSPTGARIELKNDSDKQMTYGDPFSLEKEIDGDWYQVPTIIEEYSFTAIGYELGPSETGEKSIDWKWLYGELAEGKYRIIITILSVREPGDYDEYVLAAPFSIER